MALLILSYSALWTQAQDREEPRKLSGNDGIEKMPNIPMLLRPRHTSDVQKAIIETGLDVAKFVWKQASGGDSQSPTAVSLLVYPEMDAHYKFDYWGTGNSKISAVRKPGLHLPQDRSLDLKTWEEQLAHFKEWLKLLKADIEAPNWLEILTKERELLESSISASDENERFTEEEKSIVSEQLDGIQELLVNALKEQNLPLEEHKTKLDLIAKEVLYLKEGADRLGKKDWKNTAISTFFGLISTVAFSSEARTTIINAVKNLVDYLSGIHLLLPPI